MNRLSFWDRNISPRLSLLSALLLMIPFLLIRDPMARTVSLAPLLVLSILTGKGRNLIRLGVMWVMVFLVGLYPATGRELVSWGFLVVGEDSVVRGMGRASFFCGLILLSRMALRPGLAGKDSFFGGIFSVFDWFSTRLGDFRHGDPAETLDRLLQDCGDPYPVGNEEPDNRHPTPRKTSPGGWLLVTVLVLLFLAPLVVSTNVLYWITRS